MVKSLSSLQHFENFQTTMPLLETCNELFGSSDLYTVLGVEKTASQGQIKKAYHKVSAGLNMW